MSRSIRAAASFAHIDADREIAHDRAMRSPRLVSPAARTFTLGAAYLALCAACNRTAPTAAPAAAPSSPPAAAPAPPPVAARPASPASLHVESPARETLLAAGDPVPTFHAIASNGSAVDVTPTPRAHALVVYFYPRDETPGCIIEAEAFRDARDVYDTAGIDVIGVSTDTDEAHRGFAANHQLPFALVADPAGQVAAAFGVQLNNGHAQRTTFIVDRQGHIARVFSPVQPRGHSDEVIAAVRALSAPAAQ